MTPIYPEMIGKIPVWSGMLLPEAKKKCENHESHKAPQGSLGYLRGTHGFESSYARIDRSGTAQPRARNPRWEPGMRVKSGVVMGVDPRPPANRGWDPHPGSPANRGWDPHHTPDPRQLEIGDGDGPGEIGGSVPWGSLPNLIGTMP